MGNISILATEGNESKETRSQLTLNGSGLVFWTLAARLGRPLSRSSAELCYFAPIPRVNKEPLQYRAILLNREMFMPL